MWFTTQQRLLSCACGVAAGGALYVDQKRWFWRATDAAAERFVSPPPPSAPLPVRWPPAALGSLTHSRAAQPPPPLLSAQHRAQLARAWNEGAASTRRGGATCKEALLPRRSPLVLYPRSCGHQLWLRHQGVPQTWLVSAAGEKRRSQRGRRELQAKNCLLYSGCRQGRALRRAPQVRLQALL